MNKQEVRNRISIPFVGTEWVDSSGESIWYIFSALRGPDSNDAFLKERTTWRIRKAVAPNFFSPLKNSIPDPDKPRYTENKYDFRCRLEAELKTQFPTAQDHFLDHYGDACWTYWKIYGGE